MALFSLTSLPCQQFATVYKCGTGRNGGIHGTAQDIPSLQIGHFRLRVKQFDKKHDNITPCTYLQKIDRGWTLKRLPQGAQRGTAGATASKISK